MATAALVDRDIQVGREIVASLTRSKVPVSVSLWAFVSDQWLFIIATPLVDSKGPLAAYEAVNKALRKGGISDEAVSQRIFLVSPNSRELKLLERQSKSAPYEAIRPVNASIAGRFVEDAYLYTGFIQINRLPNRGEHSLFSVFYAPYEGPGGFVPPFHKTGVEHLRTFLKTELHMGDAVIETVLRDLDKRESATVPNVELKKKDLKRLGLI